MDIINREVYGITLEVLFASEADEYIIQCRDKDGNSILGGVGAVFCRNIMDVLKIIESTHKMLNQMPRKESESKNDEIRASQG